MPVVDMQEVTIRAQTPNRRTIQPSTETYKHSDHAKFADVSMVLEDGKILLKNPSIVTIGSLLARYQDSNDNTVLVNLKFNTPIPPMMNVELDSFAHASEMQIMNTAPLSDFETGWHGDITCDREKLDEEKTERKFCYPTPAEEDNYIKILSRIHYFSNTAHALRLLPAWFAGEMYDGLDLSDATSSPLHTTYDRYVAAPHKKDYIQRALFKTVMSNHRMRYGVYHGKYLGASGAGGGRFDSLLGDHTEAYTGTGGLQLMHSYVDGKSHNGLYADQANSTYGLVYHEVLHGKEWHHDSGLTYGYPYAVANVMGRTGMLESVPVLDTPKYVFTHTPKAGNAVSFKVFKTSDADENDLAIEMLSSIKLLGSDYTI